MLADRMVSAKDVGNVREICETETCYEYIKIVVHITYNYCEQCKTYLWDGACWADEQ